jgi:hypothetical protein
MRRITTLCLAALLAGSVTACDGGNGSSGVPGAENAPDAADAADAIQALGAINTIGSGTASGPVQPIRTAIDYRHNTMRGEFPPGVPTKPVRVGYRAEGDTAWFSREVAKGEGQIALGADLLVLRPPTDAPWVEVPRASYYANIVMRPWDPVFLLSDLAAMPRRLGPAVRFRPSGSAVVRGVRRPGFTARMTLRQAGYIGLNRVTLWTDRHGVPVRVRIETQTLTRGTYDITRRQRDVVVRPPAPSQIARADTPLPSASGPYVEIASGTAGTTAYRVLRAPATDGGTCWKVESDPAYVPQDEPRADGGVCAAPITTSGEPLDQVGFPIDGTADTPYEIFGLLLPEGSTAEASFFDGTRRPVPLDPSGLALVVGPSEPVLGAMVVTLADGKKLSCGPGPINGPADLEGTAPEEAFSAPWNCLPAD